MKISSNQEQQIVGRSFRAKAIQQILKWNLQNAENVSVAIISTRTSWQSQRNTDMENKMTD